MTSSGPAAMPRTTKDVLSQLGTTQVMMARKDAIPKAASKLSGEAATDEGGAAFEGARWRQPQVISEDGQVPPRPRAGHTAVLEVPSGTGETPAVLIYGGLGDGGLPLGDTFELRMLETQDQSLEAVWTLLDGGGREHCETAPWEQHGAPRPRMCHSAVFWPNGTQRSMVIFGGLGMGLEGEPRAYGDAWMFLVGSSSSCGGRLSSRGSQVEVGWKRPMMQGGAPARRWGHGACLVGGPAGGGSTMLVCGGIDGAGNALADCWALHLEEMRWEAVEECASQLLPLRSMLPSCSSPLLGAPACAAPEELGRCRVTWSSETDSAMVWSCHGFWRWREPEQLQMQRSEKRKQKVEGSSEKKKSKKEARKKRRDPGSKEEDQELITDLAGVDEWRHPDGESGFDFKAGVLGWKQASSPAAKASLAAQRPSELPSVLPPQRRRLPPALLSASAPLGLSDSPEPNWPPAFPKMAADPAYQSWPPQRPSSRAGSMRRGPPSAPSNDSRRSAASSLDLGPVMPRAGTPLRHERDRPPTPRRTILAPIDSWAS